MAIPLILRDLIYRGLFGSKASMLECEIDHWQ
jgi:hypothetical protein